MPTDLYTRDQCRGITPIPDPSTWTHYSTSGAGPGVGSWSLPVATALDSLVVVLPITPNPYYTNNIGGPGSYDTSLSFFFRFGSSPDATPAGGGYLRRVHGTGFPSDANPVVGWDGQTIDYEWTQIAPGSSPPWEIHAWVIPHAGAWVFDWYPPPPGTAFIGASVAGVGGGSTSGTVLSALDYYGDPTLATTQCGFALVFAEAQTLNDAFHTEAPVTSVSIGAASAAGPWELVWQEDMTGPTFSAFAGGSTYVDTPGDTSYRGLWATTSVPQSDRVAITWSRDGAPSLYDLTFVVLRAPFLEVGIPILETQHRAYSPDENSAGTGSDNPASGADALWFSDTHFRAYGADEAP